MFIGWMRRQGLTRDLQPRADTSMTDASSSDNRPRSLPRQSSVIQSPLLDFTFYSNCYWSNWRWKAVVARSIFGNSIDRASIRTDGVTTANGDEDFRAVLNDHQSSCTLNTLAFPLTRSKWTVIQGLLRLRGKAAESMGEARQNSWSFGCVGWQGAFKRYRGVPSEPTFHLDIISSLPSRPLNLLVRCYSINFQSVCRALSF
jgi:hypothetical protein